MRNPTLQGDVTGPAHGNRVQETVSRIIQERIFQQRITTAAKSAGTSTATLAALLDVVLTSPLNGQALTYNSSSSKWVNTTLSTGGGGGGGIGVSFGAGAPSSVIGHGQGDLYFDVSASTYQGYVAAPAAGSGGPAVDGATASNSWSGSATGTVNLAITTTAKLAMLVVDVEHYSNLVTVSGVSSPHLSWSRYVTSANRVNASTPGVGGNVLEIWTAPLTTGTAYASETVTVTTNVAVDDGALLGVCWNNIDTSYFDTTSPLPKATTMPNPGAANSMNITGLAAAANTALLYVGGSDTNEYGGTVPSGFTSVGSTNNGGGSRYAGITVAKQVNTSAVTGQTVVPSFTQSGSCASAIVLGLKAPAVVLSWVAFGGSGGGGGGGSSSTTVVNVPPDNVVLGTDPGTSGSTGWANYTLALKISGRNILNYAAVWRLWWNQVGSVALDIDRVVLRRTLRNSTTFLDSTTLSFNGQFNAYSFTAGVIASDSITVPLDADHDYWVLMHVSATANASAQIATNANATTINGLETGYQSLDHTGDATSASFAPGPTNAYGWIRASVVSGSAVPGASVIPDGLNIVAPLVMSGTNVSWNGYTLTTAIIGSELLRSAKRWKFDFRIAAGSADIGKALIRRTLTGSATVIDTTNVTWGASLTPTLPVGVNFCDAIDLTIDPQHDYYIQVYLPAGTNNNTVSLVPGGATSGLLVGLLGFRTTGDQTTTALPTLSTSQYMATGTIITAGDTGDAVAVLTPYDPSVLLLHFEGANGATLTTDSSKTPLPVTVQGGAVIDTSKSKFGTSSLKMVGASPGGVSIPFANLSLNDAWIWTIDFWIWPNSWFQTDTELIGQWAVSGSGLQWIIDYNTSNHLQFFWAGNFPSFGGGAISTGAWHHIAVVRNFQDLIAFLDGQYYGHVTVGSAIIGGTSTSDVTVGYQPTTLPNTPGISPVDGWMDEIRFVKGKALFGANYNVPVVPYLG
jgi:hypothetical protein